MTLPIKEYYHNMTTGEVTIEYSDDSTRSFNMNDSVTAVTNPVTGGNRFIESLVRNPDGLISGNIKRDGSGAITSASVIFPDGVEGIYTALVLSADFPGAVDSYSITYGSRTYTQPAVTRDSSGAVTVLPDLEFS